MRNTSARPEASLRGEGQATCKRVKERKVRRHKGFRRSAYAVPQARCLQERQRFIQLSDLEKQWGFYIVFKYAYFFSMHYNYTQVQPHAYVFLFCMLLHAAISNSRIKKPFSRSFGTAANAYNKPQLTYLYLSRFPSAVFTLGSSKESFLVLPPIFPFSPTTPVKPERTGTKSAFYPDGTSSSGKSVPRKGSPCFASGDCLSQKSRNWEHRSSEAEAKIQPANSHPLLPGSRRDTPLPARRAAHLHPRKKPPVPPPDSTQDLCDSTRRALPSPSPQHGGLRMSTPPPQH